jgi:hypothetical protein
MVHAERLDTVVQRIGRYASVRPTREPGAVRVRGSGENGYDIALSQTDQGLRLELGGWSRTLPDLESAWNILALAITNRCRLRIEYGRSGILRWVELLMPDGSWRTLPEPNIEPDRLNPNVRYRANTFSPARDPLGELAAASARGTARHTATAAPWSWR